MTDQPQDVCLFCGHKLTKWEEEHLKDECYNCFEEVSN
jgi:hypothetical protein